jgi:hypothetical protein
MIFSGIRRLAPFPPWQWPLIELENMDESDHSERLPSTRLVFHSYLGTFVDRQVLTSHPAIHYSTTSRCKPRGLPFAYKDLSRVSFGSC